MVVAPGSSRRSSTFGVLDMTAVRGFAEAWKRSVVVLYWATKVLLVIVTAFVSCTLGAVTGSRLVSRRKGFRGIGRSADVTLACKVGEWQGSPFSP